MPVYAGISRYKNLGGENGKKMNKSVLAIVLAATLLISAVGLASADPAFHWDFDDDGIMYQGVSHVESGNIAINKDTCYTWRSDQSAVPAEGVYFPPEVWQGRLTTEISLYEKYTVDVGYSNADRSGFVSNGNIGSQTVYYSSQGASHFGIDANGFTVPQGKYLALKVCNTGEDPSFTVNMDYGSSYLDWPRETDFPVPELCTFGLFGIGLLTLMGYVRHRRRTKE